VGVVVDSKEARDILLENGAQFDEKTGFVKLPEELVIDQVAKAPDFFFLYGPDGNNKVKVGGNTSQFATQGMPSKIYDHNNPNQPRDVIMSDLDNFLKVADTLDFISCSHFDLWPTDIPYEVLHGKAIKSWVQNSKKPFGFGCRGKYMSQDCMELTSLIVGGEDELMKRPRHIAFFNPISPLTLPKILLGGLIIFAEYNQPIIIAPAATGGLNAPVTIAGLLVQTNAEVLSSIVLTQLINPGTPILYGSVNTPIDPQTGNVAWGSIETALITTATAQLARYYNVPSRAAASITNSNTFDMQNGFDRYMTLSAAVNAGINYVTCAGTYECGLASSLELLAIDNELAGMILKGSQGITINEETLAYEKIKYIALNQRKGAHFLELKHTVENFRKEIFIPKLSERNTRATWLRKGAKDIFVKAHEAVNKILTTHPSYEIEPNLERKIDKYIEGIKERNINEYTQ